jgi:DNA primase
MSLRLPPETLHALRNDLKFDSVVYALEIKWRIDDMKFRFICPHCHGLDTSVHPKTNLGRCFSCQKNFNTIDLVMARRGYPFRKAVCWLLTLRNLLETDDGRSLVLMQASRNRMK